MKRIEPEGSQISVANLKLAILNLNAKLRRKGNISAFEINQARDQNTGKNLVLNDEEIRNDQLNKRKDHRITAKPHEMKIGDTVRVKNQKTKHSADDIYLITDKDDEDVTVQKLLHPLKNTPKFMSKIYKANSKILLPIHQPTIPRNDVDITPTEPVFKTNIQKKWNPINMDFFEQTDSEDEERDAEDSFIPITKFKTSPVLVETDQEIEWDDSPELLQLGIQCNEENLVNTDTDSSDIFKPRILFTETSSKN